MLKDLSLQATFMGLLVAFVGFASSFAVVLHGFTGVGGPALAAARGRDAIVSNPELTIWTGRVAGLLLVAVAVYMLLHESVFFVSRT